MIAISIEVSQSVLPLQIDFQLCIWATPAIDLIFALYGMVGNEARERREELIRHYHEHFTRTLQKLGYLKNAPTLQDLQVELLRNGLIGKEVIMMCTMGHN